MTVDINITKKVYDFIDGATGEKISAEEFAKKYPGVGLARYVTSNGNTQANERTEENKTA